MQSRTKFLQKNTFLQLVIVFNLSFHSEDFGWILSQPQQTTHYLEAQSLMVESARSQWQQLLW